MEQVATESLRELATRRLREIHSAEQVVEQVRNTEVSAERVPLFHTPLGVEHGTQRALVAQNDSSVEVVESERKPVQVPGFSEPAPCSRCRELDSRGIRTLLCGSCAYETPRPPERSVRYPRHWLDQQVPVLPRASRECYEQILNRLLHFGWSETQASSEAFSRMLRWRGDGE